MEKQQKELLDYLDNDIIANKQHLEFDKSLGPDGRYDYEHELKILMALRRLVEKFYGEWKPRLQKFSAEMEDKNSTRPIEASMAKIIVESWKIRDFDPMASDEGEKGGRR